MSDLILEQFNFDSHKAGKHLVVLGAVHGNEKCGTVAIRRAIAEIDAGTLKLATGKVTFLPICNPRAYAQNVRFVERNLNRYLVPKAKKIHYEDFLDEQLCAALTEADVLLDLHSYESAGGPFIFLGRSEAENEFAKSLGVSDFVYGWAEAFSKSSDAKTDESIGTTDAVRNAGGMGVTLECGHHANADAPEIGYQAILRAMSHLGIITRQFEPPQTTSRCVKMEKVFYKQKAGQWAKPLKHYDFVAAGEVIAIYADGEQIVAEKDGYIVLPKASAPHEKIGAEWFYFGAETEFPKFYSIL